MILRLILAQIFQAICKKWLFNITIMKLEKLAGMGAITHENGVAFRVWAPNADKVFVSGAFNKWEEESDELESEENGFWYGNVENAKFGDEYKFVIFNGEQKLLKNDPYARRVNKFNRKFSDYRSGF